MGCTSSSLNRRCGGGRKGLRRRQRQAICVVGSRLTQRACFPQERSKNRVRSWSPEEAGRVCDEAVLIADSDYSWSVVEKDFASPGAEGGKQAFEGLSDSGAEEREEDGGDGRQQERGRAPADRRMQQQQQQPFLPRLHLLESPAVLCSEQERRLRCVNLEVPAGLIDPNSDESDDEGEGFEFAKVEASLASCESERGRAIEVSAIAMDASFSENWERAQACSICDPELEVLIIPTDLEEEFPATDAVNSLPESAELPVLESFDQSFGASSISDDSLFSPSSSLLPNGYFPGFATYPVLACSSSSLSSACFSESIPGYSPANDSVGDPLDDPCRIGDFPTTPSSLECANWDQTSPGTAKWDSPSPPDSALYDWDQASPSESPLPDCTFHSGALIPGLPNDLAQLCLMRVPFVKYDPSLRMVCRQWRAVLSSEEFFKTRQALGIHEAHISFVVHGNRVQVFSLQTYQWFCLPPLPRDDGNISPAWRVSPEWDSSPTGVSSDNGALSDWGIDPYDWWQLDTVAVVDGTIYVIGGYRAEIHSFTRPSKPTSRVHKYDFCRNQWVAVSPMLVSRSHAAAVSLGKFIYVAGGSEDREEGASAEVYDCDKNMWSFIPSMNTSMRTCMGMEHNGCFYVKGENTGPGSLVEGEIYNLVIGRWDKITSGMRRGLERGPVASSSSNLFVADWKDSLLKMYDPEQDSWLVLAKLPARVSRLIAHSNGLYGLTGKIKVDPYNHHVISDAPAEVWKLDLGRVIRDQAPAGRSLSGLDPAEKAARERLVQREQWDGLLQAGAESISSQRERGSTFPTGLLEELIGGSEDPSIDTSGKYVWECLWRDPKMMVKSGGLAWVPCIAHCTSFED